MNEVLLTKSEAAKRLNISERTIDAWRASGRLKSVRLSATAIRFRPQDIDALIEHCLDATPKRDEQGLACVAGGTANG